MKDVYGNTILATVNGWTIVAGEFCYVLTKPGQPMQVTRGTLAAAETLAAQS